MPKNKIPHEKLIEAELNALAAKTIERVKDDETLLIGGVYKRMMDMLETRFQEMGDNPPLPVQSVNDWLALALFMENRVQFLELCQKADKSNDPIYQRAKHWLVKIADKDMQNLARK